MMDWWLVLILWVAFVLTLAALGMWLARRVLDRRDLDRRDPP